MSLIPSGLLASLPASLWPDTIAVYDLALNVDSTDETAPVFSAETSNIKARKVPLNPSSEAGVMALYEGATHKFLTRELVSGIKNGDRIVDQNGTYYQVHAALTPGEAPFNRLIVEQLP